ncbi:MAG: thiolase family protein, partial [Solirubrobacterales bacterium]|nr:thiolase family protein [Solirubrobacterales bacterium]
TGLPIITVENACASGTTAYHEARAAVESGRYGCVLALGVEHMSTRFDGPIAPEPTDAEQAGGLLLPALYALSASRYAAVHGTTPSDLAQVAVKNSGHGARNPRAQRRRALTEAEVLGSRPIAEPLTLFQCAGLTDAAAAAVLGPRRRRTRDIPIRASVLRSGRAWDQDSERVWGFDVIRETASEAYAQAGITPEEVDLAEVHDAFTIGELVTVEALGLAPEGRAAESVRDGEFTLGGRRPVNPSGGLLSRGHPLGATGLAQVAEAVWQLREEAGPRQVEGARTALVETMGGGASGLDANGCVVTVLGG